MDLLTYQFPKAGPFDDVRTDPVLLAEARVRGFYGGHTPYNKLFSNLFFNGGKLDLKKDLPEDFRKAALPYLKALMQSFTPSHEDKEAVCAMLLSELVDL